MKYYCKTCDPDAHIRYTESWINHDNANGSSGKICTRCNTEYSVLDEVRTERSTPSFKLIGAGWASKDIKLQRDAVKQYINSKYRRVDGE